MHKPDTATTTTDPNRHGALDAEASAKLDALLDALHRAGMMATASDVMSRAIKLYHAGAFGDVEIVSSSGRDRPGGFRGETTVQ